MRSAAGDERIEAQIPALRRYAYALTRHREDADDLVQDCLERALSRWTLRRAEGELRAWLFTILRNLYIDRTRAARRRPVETSLEFAPPLASSEGSDRGLELRDALTALDRLPEEQRSLLLLLGVEELSYQEAAQVLRLPVGTIMSRLSRAREALRHALRGNKALLRRVK